MDLAAVLARVPIFQGLDSHELASFARRGRMRRLPANARIFSEGEAGEALYVVVEGAVKVFLSGAGGRELVLALERAGGYFGELSMVDGLPRSASVMTIEPTRLLVLSRVAFRECLAGRSDVAYRLIIGLAARLRSLTDNVGALATDDVHRRVVAVLLRLAERRDGEWLIPARPSHQLLADMVGSSREMAGRAVRELIRAGHVSICGKSLVLHPTIRGALS